MKAYLTSELELNSYVPCMNLRFHISVDLVLTHTRVHVLQAFGAKVKTTSETLELATHGAKMCNSTHIQNQINQKAKWRNNNNFYPV